MQSRKRNSSNEHESNGGSRESSRISERDRKPYAAGALKMPGKGGCACGQRGFNCREYLERAIEDITNCNLNFYRKKSSVASEQDSHIMQSRKRNSSNEHGSNGGSRESTRISGSDRATRGSRGSRESPESNRATRGSQSPSHVPQPRGIEKKTIERRNSLTLHDRPKRIPNPTNQPKNQNNQMIPRRL